MSNDIISTEEFKINRGYFSVQEFCIENKLPTKRIANLIYSCHIEPMNKVREALGSAIKISKKSGYRPRAYELSKDRPGTSQHNFEDSHEHGTGAADYTCAVASDLIPLLLEHTCYNRICHYQNNNFVHCDFKPNPGGGRAIYTCDSPTGTWKLKERVEA